jgi:hypothetical protein
LTCLWVDRLILLHATIIFFVDALAHAGLRPRRHAVQQHVSQAPHMVGQSCRHGWRPRLPPLDRARLRNRIQLGQGQSQTRVGQHTSCRRRRPWGWPLARLLPKSTQP